MPKTVYGIEDALTAISARIAGPAAGRSKVVIAIDGRCGSGKTTLATHLQKRLGAAVLHADEFFLRPEQRTSDRYAQPGGNMDRERLAEEVLLPLQRGEAVVYRPFDCSQMALGQPILLPDTPVVVVEGSYSCHPDLWDLYALHIFCDVEKGEQLRRLAARDGEGYLPQFENRWIPLEEAYFTAFEVEARCALCVRL